MPHFRDASGASSTAVRLAPSVPSADLEALCEKAIALYGARALENIDLSRLDSVAMRAAVLARALMERGDVRAFALGRVLLSKVETT